MVMRVSSLARYLAPVALVATITVTFLVIRNGLRTAHRPAAPTLVSQRHSQIKRSARYYVVAPGNTLSLISLRTGTSVPALERLNPSLNPNSLQVGERLRLKR